MAYFVTGATGFIGRRLVERLLERKGKIHVLVREDSLGRLDELIERWEDIAGGTGGKRVHPWSGTCADRSWGWTTSRWESSRDHRALLPSCGGL